MVTHPKKGLLSFKNTVQYSDRCVCVHVRVCLNSPTDVRNGHIVKILLANKGWVEVKDYTSGCKKKKKRERAADLLFFPGIFWTSSQFKLSHGRLPKGNNVPADFFLISKTLCSQSSICRRIQVQQCLEIMQRSCSTVVSVSTRGQGHMATWCHSCLF